MCVKDLAIAASLFVVGLIGIGFFWYQAIVELKRRSKLVSNRGVWSFICVSLIFGAITLGAAITANLLLVGTTSIPSLEGKPRLSQIVYLIYLWLILASFFACWIAVRKGVVIVPPEKFLRGTSKTPSEGSDGDDSG